MSGAKLLRMVGVLIALQAVGLGWAAAPRPPRDLEAIDPEGDQGTTIRLVFRRSLDDGNGANNATAYLIYRRVSGETFGHIGSVPATGADTYSYLATGLTPGVNYGLAVTCTNGTEESERVIVWRAPLDTAAPRPPRDLRAVDPPGDQGTNIKVIFRRSLDDGNGSNDVKLYTLYRRIAGVPFSKVATINANGSDEYAYVFTGLDTKVSYGFGVSCTDLAGNESELETVWKAPTDTMAPRPPRDLQLLDPKLDQGTSLRVVFRNSLDDGAAANDVKFYTIWKRRQGEVFTEAGKVNATGAAIYAYIVTGLTKDESWGIGVTCTDNWGNRSTMVTAWKTPTDTAAPRPPRDLVAADPPGDNGDRVRLVFRKSLDDGAAANDVVNYTVWRRIAEVSFAAIGDIPANGSATYEYLATGLTRNTNYGFGVTCTDISGNQSDMVIVWIKPQDTTPPGPPQDLLVADRPDDDGRAIRVTFARSSDDGAGAKDVQSYHIYQRTEGLDWQEVAVLPATGAANYARGFTGLTNGTNYGFAVEADDGVNRSERVIGWARPVDNTPPRPPRNLTVEDYPNDAGTSLRVRFDASPDDTVADREVTTYFIYRSTVATSLGTKVGEVIAKAALSYVFRDRDLIRGKTYYYVATAVGATGESSPSNQGNGKPLDDRPVAAPSNLTAADRPYDEGKAIDLEWSRSADDGGGLRHVDRYFVYRKQANLQTEPEKIGVVAAVGAATYQWTDTKVPLDLIIYEYTVRAVSVGGMLSDPAGPVRASSEHNSLLVFDPPTNLSARDVPSDSGGQIELTWYRSPSEDDIGPPPPPPLMVTQGGYGGEYEFYRRAAGQNYEERPTFVVSADGTNDPMTYVDKGLTNGTRYYYKVRYRRWNQISDFTAEVSAIPVVGTGTSAAAATSEPAIPGTLQVTLVDAPATVPAGTDLILTAVVSGPGRSSVALEWCMAGGSPARTSAVGGEGDYEAPLRLKTSRLARGSVVFVRAVASDGVSEVVSPAVTVTVE